MKMITVISYGEVLKGTQKVYVRVFKRKFIAYYLYILRMKIKHTHIDVIEV